MISPSENISAIPAANACIARQRAHLLIRLGARTKAPEKSRAAVSVTIRWSNRNGRANITSEVPLAAWRRRRLAGHAQRTVPEHQFQKIRKINWVTGRGSWIRTNDLQYPKLILLNSLEYPEVLPRS
jgi:hypothetical protein